MADLGRFVEVPKSKRGRVFRKNKSEDKDWFSAAVCRNNAGTAVWVCSEAVETESDPSPAAKAELAKAKRLLREEK